MWIKPNAKALFWLMVWTAVPMVGLLVLSWDRHAMLLLILLEALMALGMDWLRVKKLGKQVRIHQDPSSGRRTTSSEAMAMSTVFVIFFGAFLLLYSVGGVALNVSVFSTEAIKSWTFVVSLGLTAWPWLTDCWGDVKACQAQAKHRVHLKSGGQVVLLFLACLCLPILDALDTGVTGVLLVLMTLQCLGHLMMLCLDPNALPSEGK